MARKQKIAIYPGSFDPPTLGHLDVVRRAAALFDRLVVGVLDNPSKTPLLDSAARVELMVAEVGDLGLDNVEVRAFDGLTIAFASSAGASYIVRGVRSLGDLADETSMAETNRLAAGGGLETVLLPARAELSFIQGRLVREIARGGGKLDRLVSKRVAAAIRR